jgi:hypothetical protein
MTFDGQQDNLHCRLQVTGINGTIPEGKDASPVVNSLNGTLLFSFVPGAVQQTYAP